METILLIGELDFIKEIPVEMLTVTGKRKFLEIVLIIGIFILIVWVLYQINNHYKINQITNSKN